MYHDNIFVSTVFHFQLSLKTYNKFRYLHIFLSIDLNNLINYSEAA